MESKFRRIQNLIEENKDTSTIGEQIEGWLKAKDKNVLEQSLKIINEYLNKENDRGKSVTTRINILITLSGIGSAIILFLGRIILGISINFFIFLIYIIAIIFFIKSIIYLIRALKPIQQKTLNPDLIFDIQEKTFEDSIRYEITWKIWEYSQMQQFNTDRLFLLDRGQRNILLSIISFLIIGLLLFINKITSFTICNKISYILSSGFILFALFSDWIFERFSFWRS